MLEFKPSHSGGAIEVQHEPGLEPSGWYGTEEALAFLQDTDLKPEEPKLKSAEQQQAAQQTTNLKPAGQELKPAD